MKEPRNVFEQVYLLTQERHGAEYKSLFNALDHENICSVIIDGDIYWTERPSVYSDGLTDAQNKTLNKLMLKEFQAQSLYN